MLACLELQLTSVSSGHFIVLLKIELRRVHTQEWVQRRERCTARPRSFAGLFDCKQVVAGGDEVAVNPRPEMSD